METMNWPITTGCGNLGGGCESCPSLIEYRDQGRDYSVVSHMERLSIPLETKTPTLYTVSLGSDLFHEGVPDGFIEKAFEIMNRTPHHSYEIVTKRTERMKQMAPRFYWTDNIAMGVGVESGDKNHRIDDLREVPANIRFVSFLPLLAPIGKVNLAGIHWAGVGSEEWGLFRPCEDAWIKEVEDQCREQGVKLSEYYNIYDHEEKMPWLA